MVEIIKFSTPSCMNCKILGMRLKSIVDSHKDKCTFKEVDITQGNSLNITSVPWMIIKKDEEEIFNDHVSNVVDIINKIRDLLN